MGTTASIAAASESLMDSEAPDLEACSAVVEASPVGSKGRVVEAGVGDGDRTGVGEVGSEDAGGSGVSEGTVDGTGVGEVDWAEAGGGGLSETEPIEARSAATASPLLVESAWATMGIAVPVTPLPKTIELHQSSKTFKLA